MRQGARTGRRRAVWVLVGVVLVGIAGAVLVLGAEGDEGWGEESMPADGPLPEPAGAQPGFSATLSSFPLLVDDRLRVTGEESGLAAQPLTATGDQVHWRYARPDRELLAMTLAATPASGDPVVAALWDDGAMTGVDARTGEPAWRLRLVDEASLYGATFDPADVVDEGLLRVAAAEGGDVVLAQDETTLIGVDAADGTELWRYEVGLCEAPSSPMTHSRWWTMSGGDPVVVDVTCQMPDAELEILDPRSGEVTDRITSSPPWRSSAPDETGGIRPVGCRPDLTGCSLVEHHPTGSTAGLEPVRWAAAGTQLVEPAQSGVPLEGVEARPNGDFELFLVSRATGDVARTLTGENHDARFPQFADAVANAGSPDVWVASQSWNGGPPALVRLSAADASMTGCLVSPTDRPPTHVRSPGAGLVVVSDLPASRPDAFDPADPDGSVVLLAPQLRPTCAGA